MLAILVLIPSVGCIQFDPNSDEGQVYERKFLIKLPKSKLTNVEYYQKLVMIGFANMPYKSYG